MITVQRNVFPPGFIPETVEAGSFAFVKVPAPEMTVHVPVPNAGAVPFRFPIAPQTVSGKPALAKTESEVVIFTESLTTQKPSVTVHHKVFNPEANPVTWEVSELALAKAPPP